MRRVRSRESAEILPVEGTSAFHPLLALAQSALAKFDGRLPVSRDLLERRSEIDEKPLFGTTGISKCQFPTLVRFTGRTTLQAVVATATKQLVITRVAPQCVVTRIAVQHVVSTALLNEIVTFAALNHVVFSARGKKIVARRTLDACHESCPQIDASVVGQNDAPIFPRF